MRHSFALFAVALLCCAPLATADQVWDVRLDSEAREATFGTALIDPAEGIAWFPHQVDGQQGGISVVRATTSDGDPLQHLHPPGVEAPQLLASAGGELLVSSLSIDTGIQLPLQPPLMTAWLSAYHPSGALHWRRSLGTTFSYGLQVSGPVHAGTGHWRFWRGGGNISSTVLTVQLHELERATGQLRVPAPTLRFSFDSQAERVATAFAPDGSPLLLRLSRAATGTVLLQ